MAVTRQAHTCTPVRRDAQAQEEKEASGSEGSASEGSGSGESGSEESDSEESDSSSDSGNSEGAKPAGAGAGAGGAEGGGEEPLRPGEALFSAGNLVRAGNWEAEIEEVRRHALAGVEYKVKYKDGTRQWVDEVHVEAVVQPSRLRRRE